MPSTATAIYCFFGLSLVVGAFIFLQNQPHAAPIPTTLNVVIQQATSTTPAPKPVENVIVNRVYVTQVQQQQQQEKQVIYPQPIFFPPPPPHPWFPPGPPPYPYPQPGPRSW